MSCVTPLRDRGQVVPQWHKQLYEFQRIRCTICSTSPENHQKKKDHTWKACAYLCCCESSQTLKLPWKGSFWLFSTASLSRKCSNQDSLGQQQQRESPKMVHNRKANCYPLLKRITKLKGVNSVVKLVNSDRKGVASSGPMAPCRSHHRYYTRQDWIF